MRRVRHQSMAAQILGEDALAGPARFVLAHRREAELAPNTFRAFDNERRGVGVELIRMRPHPAVLGLFEDKGEGVVEFLASAEPDKFVLARFYRWPEGVREFVACPRVQTVGSDDQIELFGKFASAGDLGLKT